MANSISGFSTFVTKTVISSSAVNSNFSSLVSGAPLWQKITIGFGSINTTSASFTATVYNLDPKESAIGYVIKNDTAFAGTAITSITVSLGITGDNSKHLDEFNVGQAVTDTAFDVNNVNLIESFVNTTTIFAKFTASGANLDSLTAGSVDIWVLKNTLP